MLVTKAGSNSTEILQALRVYDVDKTIFELEKDATPFYTFSQAISGGARVVENPKFNWFEYENPSYYTQVNNGAGYNSAATTIVVDTSTYIQAYDVMRNIRTGEIFMVTVSSAAGTLTVTRDYTGGTGEGTAMLDNDVLVRIDNVYPEGAESRENVYPQPTEMYNYTEIIRTPFKLSRTLMNSAVYAGQNPKSEEQARKMFEHKLKMEHAMLFNKRKEDTTTFSTPARSMSGLFEKITTNVTTDTNGTLTEDEFITWAQSIFKYDSSPKLLMCGSIILEGINRWARTALQISPEAKKYGLNLRSYITPYGEFMISYSSRIFQMSPELKGTAVAITPKNIQRVTLKNSDTKLRQLTVDIDGEKWEYLTEASIQIKGEKTHGILQGVTAVV